MENFDFEKGGSFHGMYYPALKPVGLAVKKSKGDYYVYEPGNATRYEVLFGDAGGQTVVTIVNMRRAMIVPHALSLIDIGYMHEKLGLNEGDCYALIPLINYYIEMVGK